MASGTDVSVCFEPGNDDKCELWTARYDGTGKANDDAHAVAVDPDGNRVFVTGESVLGSGSRVVTTVAYSATSGVQLWTTSEDRAGAEGRTIEVTPDGQTVLVGGSGGASGMHLMAYDAATGTRRWGSEHVSGVSDRIQDLVLSHDGATAFITGYGASTVTETGIEDYDFTTAAFDVATGTKKWAANYQGAAHFWDIASGIDTGVVSETGQEVVAVTGRSNVQGRGNNQTDMVTVGYDAATGSQLWENRLDGPAHDADESFALDIEGDAVFVTGESWGPLEDDYETVAYDLATGQQRWSTRRAVAGSDRPLAILASSETVYVTGHAECCLPDRILTVVAYDRHTGAVKWEMQRTGPLGEVGHELSLSPDGASLYVGGMRGGHVVGAGIGGAYPQAGYALFLVVALDATTGAQEWAAQFQGSSFSGDMTMTEDGSKLFITGGGQSSLSGDYTTAAYSP